MNNNVLYSILSWVIPSSITIAGVIAQSLVSDFLSKKNLKRQYIYKIYDKRIEAYQEFYQELVKYRMLFEPVSLDLLVQEDHSDFDYYAKCENIFAFFREREVYYDDELNKIFKALICNNQIQYTNKSSDSKDIVNDARKTVKSIDDCLALIKKSLGFEKLNKTFK